MSVDVEGLRMLRAEVASWKALVAQHCREWRDAEERGEHMDSYGADLNEELWGPLKGQTLCQFPEQRHMDVLLRDRSRLTAERDALKAEVERLLADQQAYFGELAKARFVLADVVAERDALKAGVERLQREHSLTRQEREAALLAARGGCYGCAGLSGLHSCDPESRPCVGLLGRATPMAHKWDESKSPRECFVCLLRDRRGTV